MGMSENCRYTVIDGQIQIGEHNEDGKLDGRGIIINKIGIMQIGYWSNGSPTNGSSICIYDDGKFSVKAADS